MEIQIIISFTGGLSPNDIRAVDNYAPNNPFIYLFIYLFIEVINLKILKWLIYRNDNLMFYNNMD